MPLLAANYLAASLLTILMPIGLLLAIGIWHMLQFRRAPQDTPASSPSLPPPEMVAAASPSPEEIPPPAEPPSGEP